MSTMAFVSVSFRHRDRLSNALDTIEQVLQQRDVRPHIFVRAYTFTAAEAQAMMQTTLRDITRSDLLIAEVTYKAVGIGIEVGYAYALHKPIFYVRRADAEHSTTVGGLADAIIIYTDTDDLRRKLDRVLAEYV